MPPWLTPGSFDLNFLLFSCFILFILPILF